ncbi:hypothetical protein AZF37_07180 [endosymbiont 'TC1' of Trimyema compressum]|nr:hypothetical protein AZF37_07180 [endosymbiont 'TC1' of Trimyema compressum]
MLLFFITFKSILKKCGELTLIAVVDFALMKLNINPGTVGHAREVDITYAKLANAIARLGVEIICFKRW